MEREIAGDVRRYLIIHTTDYDDDGKYSVVQSSYDELPKNGVNTGLETYRINYGYAWSTVQQMEVGDTLTLDQEGAYLMRIA